MSTSRTPLFTVGDDDDECETEFLPPSDLSTTLQGNAAREEDANLLLLTPVDADLDDLPPELRAALLATTPAAARHVPRAASAPVPKASQQSRVQLEPRQPQQQHQQVVATKKGSWLSSLFSNGPAESDDSEEGEEEDESDEVEYVAPRARSAAAVSVARTATPTTPTEATAATVAPSGAPVTVADVAAPPRNTAWLGGLLGSRSAAVAPVAKSPASNDASKVATTSASTSAVLSRGSASSTSASTSASTSGALSTGCARVCVWW